MKKIKTLLIIIISIGLAITTYMFSFDDISKMTSDSETQDDITKNDLIVDQSIEYQQEREELDLRTSDSGTVYFATKLSESYFLLITKIKKRDLRYKHIDVYDELIVWKDTVTLENNDSLKCLRLLQSEEFIEKYNKLNNFNCNK